MDHPSDQRHRGQMGAAGARLHLGVYWRGGGATTTYALGDPFAHGRLNSDITLPLSPPAPTQVHLGTNDIGQGHNLSTMLADMTTLLTTIKTGVPGATTLIASIINFRSNDTNPVLLEYNAALPGVVAAAAASGQQVHFADVNRRSNWCTGPTIGFPCTGVHPTTAGYAGMAMAFFEVLAPLMPLPAAPAPQDQLAYAGAWA